MSMPLKAQSRISIVTISYNQAAYLRECMDSVINQRYPNLEYIVVDAGSIDGSRALIESFGRAVSHKVFEPDQGPADGLNKGFARASGEIYGYLNADDRLAPGALHFVANYFMENPDVDVLCGTINMIDSAGHASLRKRTADRFDLARYAAGICTVGQQATFFRRCAFVRAGGFNAKNRITWDGELLVDMALTRARFATVRKVLGEFRLHDLSITGSGKFRSKQRDEHQRIADKIREHNVALYSPMESSLRRICYKFNVIRHIDYLV